MITEKQFSIGQPVEFTRAGVTQSGVVRGTEFVADPRRKAGWHYVVSTADYEWLDVHADRVREATEAAR